MKRLIDIVVNPQNGGFCVQFCREGRGAKSYYPTSQHIVSRVIRAVNSERARERVKISLFPWGWVASRVQEEPVGPHLMTGAGVIQRLVEAIGRHPAAEDDPDIADAIMAIEDALKESQHGNQRPHRQGEGVGVALCSQCGLCLGRM